MVNKWITALRKLFFCYSITADMGSFLRLLVNTKRYRNARTATAHPVQPVPYHLLLSGKKKTVFLRTYTGDIEIFYEVFWKQCYHLPVSVKGRLLTMVDLGANIGMTALYFSTRYDMKVYAVEPDNSNMQLLLSNITEERSAGRAQTLHAAVAAEDSTVYMQVTEKAYNTAISAEATEMSVQAVTMETVCSQFKLEKIDLLKIDIEGAEELLFSGNTEWLTRVNMLVVEIHRSSYRTTCEALLHRYGYAVLPQADQHSPQSALLWAVKL